VAVSPEFQSFIADLVAPLGPVRIRRMFGGAGLFLDDVMFALIAGDQLYFKVDDTTRPDFEAQGKGPFTYARAGTQRALTSYYQAPEFLFDDPDEMRTWARRSADAALIAAKAKPKKKRSGKIDRRSR